MDRDFASGSNVLQTLLNSRIIRDVRNDDVRDAF
jgi:hypothetical protein